MTDNRRHIYLKWRHHPLQGNINFDISIFEGQIDANVVD
jgi:hypothetical protein